jgi:hypothetical protein
LQSPKRLTGDHIIPAPKTDEHGLFELNATPMEAEVPDFPV